MKFQSLKFRGLKFASFRKNHLFISFASLASVILFTVNSYAIHPLITDDTGTQGTGKFELEVNTEYSNDNGESTTQLATTLSSGIRNNIDLVINLPYQFLRTEDEGEVVTEEGIADMGVELKWRFYEKSSFSFALKPGMFLPTGEEDKGLGDGKTAYSLYFITTKEMEPLILHFNLGYVKNRKELRDIWHYSLAGEYTVTEPLRLAFNIGGETNPDRESNIHPFFSLGGFIYTITEYFDIDFGIKTGLNKAEADYALLGGIIVRF